LTAGSGSFIEACMWLGRSCLAFEIDGTLFLFLFSCVAKQYTACCLRMNEVEAAIKLELFHFLYSLFRHEMENSKKEYADIVAQKELSWAQHYIQWFKVCFSLIVIFFLG
jgi:hypothetical protein